MREKIDVVKIVAKKKPSNNQISFFYQHTAVKIDALLFNKILMEEASNRFFQNDKKEKKMYAHLLRNSSIIDTVIKRIKKIKQSE